MRQGEGRRKSKRIEIDMGELEKIVERASRGPISEEERKTLWAALETLAWVTGELSSKNASLARLRKILFGTPKTEKTKHVLVSNGPAPEPGKSDPKGKQGGEKQSAEASGAKPKRPGHGRNGADDYPGAERVELSHPSLKPGDECPDHGCKGKVYRLPRPRVVVCVTGQAPLKATAYEREALRCGSCGKVFVAPLPEGVADRKYDETTASMIGLLKYGSGMPFNRLSRLEENLGVPLPAATQWEIVAGASEVLLPAYQQLLEEAAEGEVLYNDDTTMRILEHLAQNRRIREGDGTEEAGAKKKRTGTFTTGIIATRDGRRIALFFTGRNHAGENLTKVLSARSKDLAPPIQMCDGLERNRPDEAFETLMANCLSHGRRRFVEVVDAFPTECRFVLEKLRDVYRNDAQTGSMSPRQRLKFHQTHSRSVMKDLKTWLDDQIEADKIEPNSSLGEAIQYMRKRWEKLTLFLREPGAPLDNNITERALKKAILHRKNALFFKTENGARVGDIFMSLIHTAELAGVNAFEYLTELQRHGAEVDRRPEAWMPWNYRAALGQKP